MYFLNFLDLILVELLNMIQGKFNPILSFFFDDLP